MKIVKTPIVGCYRITPVTYFDNRGSFVEIFNENTLVDIIGDFKVKQTNLSVSDRRVLRGLHFQTGKHSQAKLITVLSGGIMDVVVDCRVNSPTYNTVATFIMHGQLEKEQLFIPKGCAHGFVSLFNETTFNYQCDEFYNKESESGILWNDETLNIDWMLKDEYIVVSDKDAKLPSWEDAYKFD